MFTPDQPISPEKRPNSIFGQRFMITVSPLASAFAAASSFLQHVESFDANAAVAASQLQLLAPDDPRQPRPLLTENFMLKYFKVRTERRAER